MEGKTKETVKERKNIHKSDKIKSSVKRKDSSSSKAKSVKKPEQKSRVGSKRKLDSNSDEKEGNRVKTVNAEGDSSHSKRRRQTSGFYHESNFTIKIDWKLNIKPTPNKTINMKNFATSKDEPDMKAKVLNEKQNKASNMADASKSKSEAGNLKTNHRVRKSRPSKAKESSGNGQKSKTLRGRDNVKEQKVGKLSSNEASAEKADKENDNRKRCHVMFLQLVSACLHFF